MEPSVLGDPGRNTQAIVVHRQQEVVFGRPPQPLLPIASIMVRIPLPRRVSSRLSSRSGTGTPTQEECPSLSPFGVVADQKPLILKTHVIRVCITPISGDSAIPVLTPVLSRGHHALDALPPQIRVSVV